jgi:hypothetical protein
LADSEQIKQESKDVMSETNEARAARYAGYERRRLERYAPPLRVLLAPEDEPLLLAVKTRRGVSKGGYAGALLHVALGIEKLGGDAVAAMEHAFAELNAVTSGKTQLDTEALKGPAEPEGHSR